MGPEGVEAERYRGTVGMSFISGLTIGGIVGALLMAFVNSAVDAVERSSYPKAYSAYYRALAIERREQAEDSKR